MSVSGKYTRYDRAVEELTGKTGPSRPSFRFVLHVLEENRNVFPDKIIPEIDAFYYDGGGASSANSKASKSFLGAAKAFVADVISNKSKLKSNFRDNNRGILALAQDIVVFANRATSAKDLEDSLKLTEYPTSLGDDEFKAKDFLPYNMDKVALSKLLEASHSAVTSASATPTSTKFFGTAASSTITDEKLFYRKPGHPDKLFDKDGNEVQKGSAEFMKLKETNNCFTTGFQTGRAGKKTLECYDLVDKCLAGNNIEECKEFMMYGQWDNDVDEVNPDMAKELLGHFGYRTETVLNKELGLQIKQFESVESWLENLQKNYVGTGSNKLTQVEVTAIADNNKLIGYLRALVAKINKNPAILNEGYTGSSLSNDPNAFNNTRFSKFGLRPKAVTQASGVPSMSSIVALQNATLANRNVVALYYGVLPTGLNVMMGGGLSEYLETVQDNNQYPIRLSKIIDESFKSFVAQLRVGGKDLDQSDLSHIQKLISELSVREDKLIKAASYTDKYVRLLSAFGESDNNKVLSMDHVEQFVDKRNSYFSKVGKKQDDLLSILKALAEATQTETKTESALVTTYPKIGSKN